MNEEEFRLICNAIESGKCVAFLGAGACSTVEWKNKDNIEVKIPGLPSGWDLAKKIAARCPSLNGNNYDLMTAAEHFIYECSGDRAELEKLVKNEINIHCEPRPIHTVLAQLTKIKFIITTNYDTLMETALDKYNRNITLHVHRRLNPKQDPLEYIYNMDERDIVLHKMHGTVLEPGTFIISKSDYIYYLATLNDMDRGMPVMIRKGLLPQSILLFLGYGLEDWNFQVIWNGVLSSYNDRLLRTNSYAIVKPATDGTRNYMQMEYWRGQRIKMVESDLTDFAIQLAEKYNLDIPQLNIYKGSTGGGS